MGTWTPTDASGASLGLTVYGDYTKIGRTVIATATVIYPVTASVATAAIGGFPFATISTTSHQQGGSVTYTDLSTLARLFMGTNTTITYPRDFSGNTFTNANLSTHQINFCAVYQANF